MSYAAKTIDGTWTGATYDALSPAITAHHAQYGETVEEVLGLENRGTLDAPDWRPIGAGGGDVNAERARRIIAGTDIEVAGHPDMIALQGRAEDQQTLMGLAMMAQLRLAAGDQTLTTFRDRENADHDLTPAQVLELWQRGAAWIQQVYAASWALKDHTPIPSDFRDDSHWPAAPIAPHQS